MKIRNLPLVVVYALCHLLQLSHCDSWITLWNKLDNNIEVHCQREGLFKNKDFKAKTLKPNERYDIKGKYPMTWMLSYYRHWCDVTSGTTSITFDVFGGTDKRINRISDSYSDWVINRGGVYRVKDGKLSIYYGENWLSEDYENIHDEVSHFPFDDIDETDTQRISPLEVHLASANLPLVQQRMAINKATFATSKFRSSKEMGKYVSDAMKNEFGNHWEVFIDQPENGKVVKRTCSPDKFMIFHVNHYDFIVCQVMR